MTKQCTKCGENKPLNDFAFLNKQKNILRSMCKLCTKQYNKEHYNKNRAAINEKVKQYRETNKEEYLAYQNNYNKTRKNETKETN